MRSDDGPPTSGAVGVAVESLSAADIRGRASAGAGALVVQQVLLRGLGLLGVAALARLLVPDDFGVVAIGLTCAELGTLVADGGIGAALIQRKDPPTKGDLRALLGWELAVATLAVVVAGTAAWPFGERGAVVLLILTSLPILAFRAPTAVTRERQLVYGPFLITAAVEAVVYYGWAIGTVVAGAGVWGLASAVVVRAVAGTAYFVVSDQSRVLAPSLAWPRVRRWFAFGLRVQATELGHALRDQLIVIGTAAIAGAAVVGLWSISLRVLSIPLLAITTLSRTNFAAMSRVVAHSEQDYEYVERSLAEIAYLLGIVVVPLAAASPALVPAVFGERWSSSAGPVLWSAIGMLIAGPLFVVGTTYCYACHDTRPAIRSMVVSAVLLPLVALSLLPFIGVEALGIGWLASSCAEAFIFVRALTHRLPRSPVPPLLVPTISATATVVVGWYLVAAFSRTPVGALIGAVGAEAAYLATVSVCRPRLARASFAALRDGVPALLPSRRQDGGVGAEAPS